MEPADHQRERALDFVQDTIEKSQLYLWVGQFEKAQEVLDALAQHELFPIIQKAREALDRRHEEVRASRKRRKVVPSGEDMYVKKRINWGREEKEAKKREGVAKDVSQKGVYETEGELIPSVASLLSIERRLEREGENRIAVLKAIEARARTTKTKIEDVPILPEVVDSFSVLTLPLGDHQYEVRLLDMKRSQSAFNDADLREIKALPNILTIFLSVHEALRSTPAFRLFTSGAMGDFYFHTKGIARCVITADTPNQIRPMVELGLKTVRLTKARQ